MNAFKFKIGNNEITSDSRFTVLLGKFKKSSLKNENIKIFTDILENMHEFPIDFIIKVFESDRDNYSHLKRSKEFLKTINNYKAKTLLSIATFSDFSKLVRNFNQILKLIYLNDKKNEIEKEIEIYNLYSQSSQLSAMKDLIFKLNYSINKNKQTLSYFERDFQLSKNQIDQILLNMEKISKKIEDKTQYKKECFNEINKITRNMEKNQEEENLDAIKKLGIDIKLSSSEKIRMLQKKAQDAQFEVNQLNKELIDEKEKYETIKPEYESYLKDYNTLIQEIEKDESKLADLSKEVENSLKVNENFPLDHIKQSKGQSFRPIAVIEADYRRLLKDIESISLPNNLYNIELPMNVDHIKEELEDTKFKITTNKDNYFLKPEDNDFNQILNGIKVLESLLYNLETIFNGFLSEINIQCHLHLEISNMEENFLVATNFIRKNNEEINWKELTTPEKVYCGTVLFISIKIILNKNPLIFSNLFLPTSYNKRGSIFRTLNKIVPIFEHDEKLKKINLIFVLSSLEMKKEINKIKVIKVKDN